MTLFEIIYQHASQLSVLIPVVAGIRYYKALNKPFKFFFYFFLIAVLTEIQAEITRKIFRNNMPGLHVYTVIEFFAFSMMFYWHIQKRGLRLLIVFNLLISILIAIINVWLYGIKGSNDLSRGYAAIFMMVYALCYLYYMFTIDDTRYMKDYPMFWICIGMLSYFAINALYFVTKTHLIHENKANAWNFNTMHSTFNILAHCLYAQSFRCLKKQKTVY